jgi:hypothetical protein
MMFNLKHVTAFPTKHKVLTKSDTTVFDYPTTIIPLTTGDVAVADEDGTAVTYTAWPAFLAIPVTASKLLATGTAGTAFIGVYGENN